MFINIVLIKILRAQRTLVDGVDGHLIVLFIFYSDGIQHNFTQAKNNYKKSKSVRIEMVLEPYANTDLYDMISQYIYRLITSYII